jgi:hypothetical protein
MATLALPLGATKALATPKGKVYAIGGAVALIVAAYLLLGGGGDTTATTTKPATAVATVPTTAAAAPTSPTAPFEASARNPFTKGDGSLPKADKG